MNWEVVDKAKLVATRSFERSNAGPVTDEANWLVRVPPLAKVEPTSADKEDLRDKSSVTPRL